MAIRVTLECGHASQLRARTTPEGYTHDWEVFVRGVDNADIQHYVEKVVFYLHETFPKPKRVLKEPPFIVKESGYAGFIIPIHIYLKNKDEPKMFIVLYDLSLQQSGPAINKVIHHSEIINNPTDEFRRKLLRGGATTLSGTEDLQEKNETKTPPMVGKPKLSGSESKKHRLAEPKTSNSFADLFGPPIKTAKISPDNKKVVQSERSSVHKVAIAGERLDKFDKSAKTKELAQKDVKREKMDEKREKRSKDHSKEKVKSKEKSKRSSSPGSKSHSSPVNKRSNSPVNAKRQPSPIQLPPAKRSSSPKVKDKDPRKPLVEKDRERDKEREKEKEKEKEKEREKEKEKDKEKDKEKEKEKGREKEKERDKEKGRESSKVIADAAKGERKKERKKHKEERDKEKKEKSKDGERINIKDTLKVTDRKVDKLEKPEKSDKEKSQEYRSISKDGRKSPKLTKETDNKVKDEKIVKSEKPEKGDKPERTKEGKSEKDRQKHKHKKRDKKERRDGSKDRDKKEKREKSKNVAERQNTDALYLTASTPLSTLLSEVPERDSSDSAPSVDEDSFPETIKTTSTKKEQDEECMESKLSVKRDVSSANLNVGIDTAMLAIAPTAAVAASTTAPPSVTLKMTSAPLVSVGTTAGTGIAMATTATTSTSMSMISTVNNMTSSMTSTSSPTSLAETKKEKLDRNRRDKAKGNRSDDRESRKRKRRSDTKIEEEQNLSAKREREREREKDNNRGTSTSPLLEPVSSSQSPVTVAAAAAAAVVAASLDGDTVHQLNDKVDRICDRSERIPVGAVETDGEQVAPDSTNNTLVESENIHNEPPVFSEDYVLQLKDLQQKIMTLQDNQELERVVQVIVETGQYEITKKTFDFDLCALDRRTVQRLQQFFSAS